MSRVIHSESHTEQSVSLMDSERGKYSTEKNYPSLLRIATYNILTMRTQEHLDELEQELSNIKWDIIGLYNVQCTTRLPGEACTILKSCYQLYQKNSVENHHIGGVAFQKNKRAPYKVTKFCAVSNRVIYLMLPTGNSTDEEIESFYEDLTTASNQENSHFVTITGDFNAKIGTK
ncbi:uncharacterized protein [Diabrotica undecimpunctata]|uniref:uncharacterized protein n=1 Tax=Diabrotica undecimpunctata TaxID=50387 RepID=UPI003B63AC1D